jgi:AcrR family transcriptional regulator
MVKKAPRRTAERIIETSLALFNRFGEPNVSTNLISTELRISPGNLYYHFPAKDELVNALFDRYLAQLNPLLDAAADVRDVEDAWFFIHSLFEQLWDHRFLYRDLNDLLSRNRRLETEVKDLLARKQRAFAQLIAGLHHQGALQLDGAEREAVATHMVVLLTWWLSYEYVRNPRHALEEDSAAQALMGGAQHVLRLLSPHLIVGARTHLQSLMAPYSTAQSG